MPNQRPQRQRPPPPLPMNRPPQPEREPQSSRPTPRNRKESQLAVQETRPPPSSPSTLNLWKNVVPAKMKIIYGNSFGGVSYDGASYDGGGYGYEPPKYDHAGAYLGLLNCGC